MLTYQDIVDARERIAGHVHRTPMLSASRVGAMAGVSLRLKAELLQKTGSFKVRGALNAIRQLSDAERARGVIGVSAGNHAQALAWAARAAGAKCTVVMPEGASQTKLDATRGYGAEVIQHAWGSAMFDRARELADERGYVFIHPFDDPRVVAGAGTTGLEILEDAPDVEAVVVPVGGGGLLSGIAVAVKHRNPAVRVYGVEPEGAQALRRSLDAGRVTPIDPPQTIADGLAAPMTTELPLWAAQHYVDDVLVVSDAEIARAMGALLSSAKLLAEPAGAAGVAALVAGKLPVAPGARVVCVASGGNVDLARIKELL
ncbi:MAG: pyridoxal-phosphate dependent enzyme [Gemmatimonadota bacterium]|nr:pyridoxal-phosphate dependent enzyme [Gemmatimonadota bacterium]